MEVTETSTQRPENWLYICPECDAEFVVPERLGPHIERHREVLTSRFSKRGNPCTMPCPGGCGRHFRTKGARRERIEMNQHVPLCDGSEPIPAPSVPARVKTA